MDLEDLSQPSRVDLRALGPPKASRCDTEVLVCRRPSVGPSAPPTPPRRRRSSQHSNTEQKYKNARLLQVCDPNLEAEAELVCDKPARRLRTAQASHTPLATFLFSVCHSAHSPIRIRCDVSAERSASVNNADAVAVAGLRGCGDARGGGVKGDATPSRAASASRGRRRGAHQQALKTGQAQAPREGHACEIVGMLSCVCSF